MTKPQCASDALRSLIHYARSTDIDLLGRLAEKYGYTELNDIRRQVFCPVTCDEGLRKAFLALAEVPVKRGGRERDFHESLRMPSDHRLLRHLSYVLNERASLGKGRADAIYMIRQVSESIRKNSPYFFVCESGSGIYRKGAWYMKESFGRLWTILKCELVNIDVFEAAQDMFDALLKTQLSCNCGYSPGTTLSYFEDAALRDYRDRAPTLTEMYSDMIIFRGRLVDLGCLSVDSIIEELAKIRPGMTVSDGALIGCLRSKARKELVAHIMNNWSLADLSGEVLQEMEGAR